MEQRLAAMRALVTILDATEERLDDHRSRMVYRCPGCREWTVGVVWDDHGCDPFAVYDAATAHRRDCAAFDMLSGLAGISAPEQP